MSTNNNKDDYSVDDLTAALGKLEGVKNDEERERMLEKMREEFERIEESQRQQWEREKQKFKEEIFERFVGYIDEEELNEYFEENDYDNAMGEDPNGFINKMYRWFDAKAGRHEKKEEADRASAEILGTKHTLRKLEGGTRDTDDIVISDDELFKQPPPKEDCPICLLCLPSLGSGSIHYACCGKMICCGCNYAPVYDNLGNKISEEKCPFCRAPVPGSIEEFNEWLQKRVEVGDAEAIFMLGCYYRDGEYGFPQDDDKALELFVRAGELGSAKAYNNVGCAYENGKGGK